VLAVLITHGYPDHYAAAGLFPKATVLVGLGDLAMIQGDSTYYSTFGKIMGALLTLPPGSPPLATRWGVMYLYRDVLFTGDSLMRKNDGGGIVPSLMSDDSESNRASLDALGPLP
jgi:hydroxyacylglutathione hydrolase